MDRQAPHLLFHDLARARQLDESRCDQRQSIPSETDVRRPRKLRKHFLVEGSSRVIETVSLPMKNYAVFPSDLVAFTTAVTVTNAIGIRQDGALDSRSSHRTELLLSAFSMA